MAKKINGLYRAIVGRGVIDTAYRTNDKVKFIKYTGVSAKGNDRIKYELVNFKGELVVKDNKFSASDIDWDVRYIIKR